MNIIKDEKTLLKFKEELNESVPEKLIKKIANTIISNYA